MNMSKRPRRNHAPDFKVKVALEALKEESWRLSNTLDSDFCVDALQEAIDQYGYPEIFNTDQGCQFTSEAFTDVLR
jgi:transposase InsO family protein